MKMGNLICTSSFSSKESSSAQTADYSTSHLQPGQHISIRTYRQLRARQMSNHTWRKTETSLIMEFSRSMVDQLEEVSNLPTTRTPRSSMQDQSWKHSIY
uniref:Putative AC4 protein n=1 Tax=Tomato chlorotic mottle virus TaxID=172391 RepID=Q8QHP9_9GEMI|nr:putative AC4 protein [Tomato chlorotic mottle virus]AAL82870.1 putative AC4 protein [Tomato chlorotic mottle virus]AAL82879.1 putative AC4 protein [Tomato chlorotic mottle virus]